MSKNPPAGASRPLARSVAASRAARPVHAGRDPGQPAGAVVHRVHGRHHGQQHLRGADVAGRLFPADVLLAGLQREPVGRPARPRRGRRRPGGPAAAGAARRGPTCRPRAGRRSPSARRTAACCPPRCRRPARPGGISRVRASRSAATAASAPRPCAASMTGRRSRISPLAPGYCSRTPNSSSSGWAAITSGVTAGDHQLDAERLGPGGQHGQGLRQAVRVGQEDAAPPGRPPGQRHRLGGRGRLIQQGRTGDRQRGQILDEGLEGEQGLQPALGDLRLVGGVGGIPGRVLQHVAADHRGGVRAVVAQSDHGAGHGVPARQAAQLSQRLRLGQRRRQAQRPRIPDTRRQRRLGQLVERAWPVAASIRSCSAGDGPMWRDSKFADPKACVSKARGSKACASNSHRSLQRGAARHIHARVVLPLCRRQPARRTPGQRVNSRDACPVRSWVPERFRGGCPFGVPRWLLGISPGRCDQQ